MKLQQITILSILLTLGSSLLAHNGEDKKKQPKTPVETVQPFNMNDDAAQNLFESELPDSFLDQMLMFPSLHPLVVHFPLVLLMLAPLFYLTGLARRNRELLVIGCLLAAGGFCGAILAARIVHPHVGDLAPSVRIVMDQHDLYADVTVWLSLVATLVAGAGVFLSKRYVQIVGLVLLMGAAGAVGLTGHYGAILTHIYGVDTGGNNGDDGDGDAHQHH